MASRSKNTSAMSGSPSDGLDLPKPRDVIDEAASQPGCSYRILPEGLGPDELALQSGDLTEIRADEGLIAPRCSVDVVIHRHEGERTIFSTIAAIETAAEVDILKAGGILPLMLRNLVPSQQRKI